MSTQSDNNLTSTPDLIAASLRAEIMQGSLPGGQPLRQDQIAARFGVSKIPVREALVQLKAEGLVSLAPNRGASVVQLSPAEAREIYIMRAALEPAVLRRAIPHLTIADLARAEETLDVMDREQNVARWGELNWEFHATLYEPADLPRLMEWVRTLHSNVARYLILYLATLDHQRVSQAEHRQLVWACRQGDVEAAEGILIQHLESAANSLVEYLKVE